MTNGPTPTEQYFPATKLDPGDVLARALATVAIVLAVGLHILDHLQEVDRVEKDRTACVRQQRDQEVELRAWNSLGSTTGLKEVQDQVKRLQRAVQRDCDKRYPDPGLL